MRKEIEKAQKLYVSLFEKSQRHSSNKTLDQLCTLEELLADNGIGVYVDSYDEVHFTRVGDTAEWNRIELRLKVNKIELGIE